MSKPTAAGQRAGRRPPAHRQPSRKNERICPKPDRWGLPPNLADGGSVKL